MKWNDFSFFTLKSTHSFNSCSHDILCSRIRFIGINPRWFSSYLSNRQQFVSVDSISSEFQKIHASSHKVAYWNLNCFYSNNMVSSVQHNLLLYPHESVILVSDKDSKVVSQQIYSILQFMAPWRSIFNACG